MVRNHISETKPSPKRQQPASLRNLMKWEVYGMATCNMQHHVDWYQNQITSEKYLYFLLFPEMTEGPCSTIERTAMFNPLEDGLCAPCKEFPLLDNMWYHHPAQRRVFHPHLPQERKGYLSRFIWSSWCLWKIVCQKRRTLTSPTKTAHGKQISTTHKSCSHSWNHDFPLVSSHTNRSMGFNIFQKKKVALQRSEDSSHQPDLQIAGIWIAKMQLSVLTCFSKNGLVNRWALNQKQMGKPTKSSHLFIGLEPWFLPSILGVDPPLFLETSRWKLPEFFLEETWCFLLFQLGSLFNRPKNIYATTSA